jgi:sugar lactone lactonase YvrE
LGLSRGIENEASALQQQMMTMQLISFRALLLVLSATFVDASDDAVKFIAISRSNVAQVVYYRLGTFEEEALTKAEGLTHEATSGVAAAPAPPPEDLPILVATGLKFPVGVAYDGKRSILYVADPKADDGAGCIFRYVISVDPFNPSAGLSAGAMQRAVVNAPSRWVTVDSAGTVYFTIEGTGKIQTVPAGAVGAKPVTLYSEAANPAVSAPGGIATDGHFLFWANKKEGAIQGTLIKALAKTPKVPTQTALGTLAANTNKAYGVCISHSNVFYSDEGTFVYAVKQTGGGSLETLTGKMLGPRGCAWDGDGTVYVADSKGNAIYSFAANMPKVRGMRQLRKVVDVDGPNGIAVIISAAPRRIFSGVLFVILGGVMAF